MSFSHGGSGHDDGTNEDFETEPSTWAQVEASPYVGLNCPYCTVAYSAAGILTPISLSDGSFAETGPSPIPSRHLHRYQHGFDDSSSLPTQGLGISTTFLRGYPTETAVGLGFGQENNNTGHVTGDTAQPTPARRVCRTAGHTPSGHGTAPVSILPHPEGLQRLQRERPQTRLETQHPQHRRTPGRRRKHPQAEVEDAFVEDLREKNMSWKVIREMFRERFQSDATEPRLQMRMTRRRKERQSHRLDVKDSSTYIHAAVAANLCHTTTAE